MTGVAGEILEPTTVSRGQQSGRAVIGEFEVHGGAVIVTSGGIGGNHDLVRKVWPADRLGPPPKNMLAGVPHHVDGRMVAHRARGGRRRHQRRPHVALCRRSQELESGLAEPRHPHPRRAVLSMVRRQGRTHGGAVLPELRFARHAETHPLHRPRLFLVRAQQDGSPPRSGCSPAPSRISTSPARTGGRC